ncbi:hypothetical protein J7F01_02800 [Streptomyces sp. ISL-22]|uniref:Secreted protein n=1 Tax=Streptomyces curacoi TaxID=146536 RepID=A0A124H615_9ACTN|nr:MULTISPECIES: DUF6344 domain-containing protein [Streptomyces]KUM79925.1 hypothetical protein AQI70_06990 [Streptomyces curacoi]MBT2422790.1 hypothetical protein [Streptomyces sp. ISL-24]MBT2431148.1 hypothetical protein [Streptomyces sp. ISL-22]
MTRNKVMNLWTTIVTAFLALCTTLGFLTPTAAAAVPHTGAARNSDSDDGDRGAQLTAPVPAMAHWAWSYTRSLPPTMKQRIRAEAHGKTPGCRHRPLTDTEAATSASAPGECLSAASPAQPLVPHQR